MARFDHLAVLNLVVDTGLVPVFSPGDVAVAKQIVNASEESIRGRFGTGVSCVGIGSKLVTKELVAAGDGRAWRRRWSRCWAGSWWHGSEDRAAVG
jgi:hypothetical protein